MLRCLALLLAVSARAETIPCGGEVTVLDPRTGQAAGTWSVPGLIQDVSPFLADPDGRAAYFGFKTCRDAAGAPVLSGALPPGGKVFPGIATLSLPSLKALPNQFPGPDWTAPLKPLPTTRNDALTERNRMIMLDRTADPLKPKLKLVDLQFRPKTTILEQPWAESTYVRDYYLGARHAYVFVGRRSLYCFDFAAGKLLWSWDSGNTVPAAQLALYEDEGRLLASLNPGGLWALDPASGKAVWQLKGSNAYGPPPLIKAGSYLLIGPLAR